MSKFAQVVTEESVKEPITDTAKKNRALHLKKKTEAQIRMQLDQFAKELSQARKNRDQH